MRYPTNMDVKANGSNNAMDDKCGKLAESIDQDRDLLVARIFTLFMLITCSIAHQRKSMG